MKNGKLLAWVPAFVFGACWNGTTGAVSFSLTSRSAGAPAASPAFATAPSPTVAAAGDSTVIALGNDTVIVRSVELVLRQVELKRSDVTGFDAGMDHGDCAEVGAGAALLSPP